MFAPFIVVDPFIVFAPLQGLYSFLSGSCVCPLHSFIVFAPFMAFVPFIAFAPLQGPYSFPSSQLAQAIRLFASFRLRACWVVGRSCCKPFRCLLAFLAFPWRCWRNTWQPRVESHRMSHESVVDSFNACDYLLGFGPVLELTCFMTHPLRYHSKPFY